MTEDPGELLTRAGTLLTASAVLGTELDPKKATAVAEWLQGGREEPAFVASWIAAFHSLPKHHVEQRMALLDAELAEHRAKPGYVSPMEQLQQLRQTVDDQ